jgi:hypothetical protein
MLNILFITALAVGLSAILIWGVRTLPAERWQMLAAVPLVKTADGSWRGLNLTYYGFFSATGTTLGILMTLLLLTSIGVAPVVGIALVLIVAVVCVPASRLVARLIEHKKNTFTVAGAAFIATLALPWLTFAISWLTHTSIASVPIFAAAAIAYALGESIGRLACLSFGCCYGLPLRDVSSPLARLFHNHNLVVQGATKKAAYASGLAGEPLIPVQAMTSFVFAIAGLTALALFLGGNFRLAAIIAAVGTWGWRACSEWLRADYRGGTRFWSYQIIANSAVVYVSIVLLLMRSGSTTTLPNIQIAFSRLVSAPLVLALQFCWLVLFLYYGKSRVTSSTLQFHVVRDSV